LRAQRGLECEKYRNIVGQRDFARGLPRSELCSTLSEPDMVHGICVRGNANALRHDHGFVAMQNEKQIGFVVYRLNDDNETAELTWMGVRPDFQRKGVGRRLVEAVEQALGKKGIHRIEVFTVAATVDYEPYALTRRFYHAMGFSEVSIEPKGFPSGDDKLLLRKQSGAQRITDTSNNA